MSSLKDMNSILFVEALTAAMDKYCITQAKLAKMAGVPRARINEYCQGKTDPGFKNVSKIATALNLSISEFFALADATTHGKSPPPEKPVEAPNPPVAAQTPPTPPVISPEREMELLRKLEAQIDIRNELAAELLAKGKIIATTTEALRIKNVEVAEKREALAAKDKLVSQLSEANATLVDILKEAGEEDRIPPDLIYSAVVSLAEAGNLAR